MRITIVGGGNIGTQFAVHCAEKGHEVTIYTSKADLYDGHLFIVDETNSIKREGFIKLATYNPVEAFRDAQLSIITLPANMMKGIAKTIYNYSSPEMIIGVVPGNGGAECAFKKCIERGNVFFGIERVPAIARLVEPGKIVRSIGYRSEIHVASIPRNRAQECAQLIESIFEIPCHVIPNYLNLTLTPSNPILHTTRLRTLFQDWHEGISYETVPLFYEEWDDASSKLLMACDDEVQEICRALHELDLRYVKSLRNHYESPTVEAMTKKISSIPAFKGLETPTIIDKEGKRIPDLRSRYFTADFSYGLTIIQQIAVFAGVYTPNIDATMDWYKKIEVEKDEFRFADFGIMDRAAFFSFYIK